MPTERATAPPASLNWVEIGNRPPELERWRDVRFQAFRRYGGVLGGILIGGLAGLVAVVVWASPMSWSLTQDLGVWVVVAIPVGIAEFFVFGWLLGVIVRASTYDVRRVAISGDRLYVEQASGRTFNEAVAKFRVSTKAVAGGWYAVSLPGGRSSTTFYVPGLVAESIVAARTGGVSPSRPLP